MRDFPQAFTAIKRLEYKLMLATIIRPYLRHRALWDLFAVLLFQLIQSLAALALPSLNADIIDRGVSAGNIPLIWRLGAAMLAMTLLQAIATGVAVYCASHLAMSVGASLRMRVFRHVQRFSQSDLRIFGAPSLITRCTNDIQQIQMVTFLICEIFVMSPLMAIGGVIMAIRQDPTMSLLLVVIIPILALAIGLITWRMRPLFIRQQQALDRISDVLRSHLSGVRVIRAFVRQEEERSRYKDANTHLRTISLAVGMLFALLFPTVTFIMSMGQVAVVWCGAHRIANHHMYIGSLTAFLNYLVLILMSVTMASFVLTMLPRAEACAGRIQEVITHNPTVVSDPHPHAFPHSPLTFHLDHASVCHPDASAPILDAVTATFAPRTTTAIIGATGSGKSTLISLLARLRDVTEGSVSINGTDIRHLSLSDLRASIAYVPQQSYLFSGTIASTVTGEDREENRDMDRLYAALDTAQAQEFISTLTDGIATRVDPGGQNFSGGQRQRLAIARALYRRAHLYVFDDSFSALDYATDAALRARLRSFVGNAAIIMVAQRVSTIRHASTILVMDRGRIIGRGRHDELLATCPTYREIVDSQIREEEK